MMTHNDLGTENILMDSRGSISVVDWANAQSQDIPLLDFFFAMASAVMTTQGYASWPQAVSRCFERAGDHSVAVVQRQRRLIHAVGLRDDLVDICFHACWLRRASGAACHIVTTISGNRSADHVSASPLASRFLKHRSER